MGVCFRSRLGPSERQKWKDRYGYQAQKREQELPVLHPDAAGIDVGASELFVAVPADRDPEPVRSFPTFTQDLYELVDWLQGCGIRSVAMESTSVYWIPVYQILEARGIEVFLLNAHYPKTFPVERATFPIANGFNTCIPLVCCGPAFVRPERFARFARCGGTEGA